MIKANITHLLMPMLMTILFTQVAMADDARLFEQARTAHLQMNWQTASDLYDRVKEEPWSQAAMCYRAHCLAAVGENDQAMDLYRQYLRQDHDQLYRGEVLLELARLLCMSSDQPASLEEADRLLQDAITWTDRQLSKTTKSIGNDPGNISPILIGPKTVLNAGTTPWYVPKLKSKIQLLHIYVATSLQKPEVAHQRLNDLKTATSNVKPAWIAPQTIRTLERDVNRGVFLLSKQAWASLTPGHAPVIRLASFYCQASEVALAKPLLLAKYKLSAQGAGKADDWAACELALATCDYQIGQDQDAIKRLRLFTGVLRATSVSSTGRLMLANLLASDKKTLAQAYQIYADLAQEKKNTLEEAQIVLASLIAAQNQGDSSAAYRAADRLNTNHANTVMSQMATEIVSNHVAPPQKASTPGMSSKMLARQETSSSLLQSHIKIRIPSNKPFLISSAKHQMVIIELQSIPHSQRIWINSVTPKGSQLHPSPPREEGVAYLVTLDEQTQNNLAH